MTGGSFSGRNTLEPLNREISKRGGQALWVLATVTDLKTVLLGGEAIEQPVAASAAQIVLAAPAIRSARGMR